MKTLSHLKQNCQSNELSLLHDQTNDEGLDKDESAESKEGDKAKSFESKTVSLILHH